MAAQITVPGCTHHPGMGFLYVCKTCDDKLLCMDCVVETHNGHTFGKLTDYVSEQRRQIEQHVKILSNTEIPTLRNDIKKNDGQENENGKHFTKTRQEIRRQGKAMQKALDILMEKADRLSEDIERKNKDIIRKNKAVLTQYLNDNKQATLDRCQQVLRSGTNVDIATTARDIRASSDNARIPDKITNAEFKPGTISTDVLERMLGKILVDGEDPQYRPIAECTVLSEYKHCTFLDSCCVTGDEAWLSHWEDNDIYRVDQSGSVKEKVECSVKVTHTAVSPTTGRVWFCCHEDRTIREVTGSGTVTTRFTVAAQPRSLCITTDDKVVVGMKGIVQMYEQNGREVTSSKTGSPCRQEAVRPHHMAYCTQTGDVAVADADGVRYDDYMAGKSPGKQPHVMVMDKLLNVKYQISRVGTSTTDGQQFYPLDICFDAAGDVLITDKVTRSVLLVDQWTGHYLRTIYKPDIGTPRCICLQKDGKLWLCDNQRGVKIIRYK